MTSRRCFVLLAASAVFNGLFSGCGGGSASQVSPPTPLSPGEAPRFQIIDLGGYEQFIPSSLNNRGEIIGYRLDRKHGALLRSPNGTVRTLALPPGVTGSLEAVGPVALNDNGASLVNVVVRKANDTLSGYTLLWQNGAAQDIGTLGGRGTVGINLNNRNQIIGYSGVLNPEDPTYASRSFLWQEGQMSELTLPAGGIFNPRRINDNGVMLGEFDRRKTEGSGYDYVGNAVLANGSLTRLRATGWAEDSFYGADLNNRGQIVGRGYEFATGSAGGYLLENGVATNLSAVGGEAEFNAPTAINGFGSVVGGTLPPGGGGVITSGNSFGRAFLYQGGRTYDLQATIPADSGWVLRDALDINDRGQILGRGVLGGEGHYFLLTPTTPTSR